MSSTPQSNCQTAEPVVYPAPGGIKPADDFRVRVGGREVFVHACAAGAYAPFGLTGPVEVEIETARNFREVKVRPTSRGIEPQVDGRRIRFRLDGPDTLSVELDGDIARPLFLWADPPETDRPSPDDPNVRYFAAGRVHEPGMIELRSGQSIYIEGGAVVRGLVRADGATGITIRGRGILDGSTFPRGKGRQRMILLEACEDVRIEGIGVVDSASWTVVPTACRHVRIEGVKIANASPCDDGFDLVGCQDVDLRHCFARTKDDCVAIKAKAAGSGDTPGETNVADVCVRESVFFNAEWGNALEIGYETRCDEMRDITFLDNDVIHVGEERHSSGAVFSIHNGDRATIHNVRVEDLRVEDAREKLIDIKVLFARYSRDPQRGHVRDVLLKDIHVLDGPVPVSIIQGYDGKHRVENVTIENLRVHGQVVDNFTDARMVTERMMNVSFVAGQ